MQLTGEMLIGAEAVAGSAGTLRAFDPSKGEPIDAPVFGVAAQADVERACELARDAFDAYRAQPLAARAAFLEAIADEIVALGDALIERAHAETGLPVARLQGERGRTVGQLRLFARVVRDGRFLAASIDPAQPARTPPPRSDLRLQKVGLGPVVVFGASNFPLAFSVAGGDTASALAAGCPVVVKAHPAHPGTSELVGCAIQAAVAQCGLPEGVFSLILADNDVAGALVADPHIQAVGFTGSRAGGQALLRIAQARPQPIPVYGELSAINPVFLLPDALAKRAAALGQQYVASLTMGAGQFCTNPGLLLAIDGPELDAFEAAAAAAMGGVAAQPMLTAGIHTAYTRGVDKLASEANVRCVARGQDSDQPNRGQAGFYITDAKSFQAQPTLHDEIFGATGLVVRCRDAEELRTLAESLEGQLTATLHLDAGDTAIARSLLPILERKAGRILANGWPTGVEVCHAMVHGGPWPATTDTRTTSVGTAAIERFLRPVCYQDLPAELLPEALQDANPLKLRRLVDGSWA